MRGITNCPAARWALPSRGGAGADAQVTLVAGPVSLPTPRHVARIDVRSALQMHDAGCRWRRSTTCRRHRRGGRRRPRCGTQKIKKDGSGRVPTIPMTENPDILAAVAKLPKRPYCWASPPKATTWRSTRESLRKNIPLIVATWGPPPSAATTTLLLVDETASANCRTQAS